MSASEQMILDPITFGHKAALGALRPAEKGDPQAITLYERSVILGKAAMALGMFGKPWWIESGQGLAMPKEPRFFLLEDILRHGTRADSELDFKGAFNGYSWLQLGKIVGPAYRRITGFCATFDKALIFSGMDPLDEDQILHVPILAVDTVEPAPDFL